MQHFSNVLPMFSKRDTLKCNIVYTQIQHFQLFIATLIQSTATLITLKCNTFYIQVQHFLHKRRHFLYLSATLFKIKYNIFHTTTTLFYSKCNTFSFTEMRYATRYHMKCNTCSCFFVWCKSMQCYKYDNYIIHNLKKEIKYINILCST